MADKVERRGRPKKWAADTLEGASAPKSRSGKRAEHAEAMRVEPAQKREKNAPGKLLRRATMLFGRKRKELLSKKTGNEDHDAAQDEPSKKRGKKPRDSAVASQATTAGARQILLAQEVRQAECIPETVREMLCSTLAGCCCVSGEFHPFQERVFKMWTETLNSSKAQAIQKMREAETSTAQAREELERFEKVHANAEAAVSVSSADAKEKENALSQCVATLQPRKGDLEAADKELQKGDASIGAAAMECEQLRLVCSQMANVSEETTLGALREMSFPAEKLEDTSSLESELRKRIATLCERVSREAMARVALVADQAAAATALEAADKNRQACAAALARSQSVLHEHVGTQKAKAQSLKQQRSVVAQTQKAYQAVQRHLADFESGAFAAFKDIVSELEKHHGIRILNGDITAREVVDSAPVGPQSDAADALHGDVSPREDDAPKENVMEEDDVANEDEAVDEDGASKEDDPDDAD